MKRFFVVITFFLISLNVFSQIPDNIIRDDEILVEQFVDDWQAENWIYDEHHIYEYNDENLLSEYTIMKFIDDEWHNSKLRTYTYDPDGLLTEMIVFNTSYGEWINYQKYTYAYFENNLLSEYIYSMWENDLWEARYRHQYIYNDNQLLIKHYRDEWTGSGWHAEYGNWFSYNSNEELIEDLAKRWIGYWTNNSRHEYSYNSHGDCETYLFFIWDDEFYEWWLMNDYFYEYEYENNIKITKTTSYYSNYDNKEVYSYNINGNLIETIQQDWSSGTWINDARISSIYETTHVYEYEIVNQKNTINVFPNPFNPLTTIEFSIYNDSKVELTIYNIKGQKIKTLAQNEFTKGLHSIIWNGDDELNNPVSSGTYFYKLNINGKTEAVKKCLLLK